VWDFKTSGSLWRLFRGGRIGVASGAEVRWESYEDKAPAYHGVNPRFGKLCLTCATAMTISSRTARMRRSRRTKPFTRVSEVSFPFITPENRKPLLHSLELSLAGRLEHFSIRGSSAKPKASLVWNPFSSLKLRGSYNESFRAPNLVQTSVTPTLRVNNADDPYRSEVTGALSDSNRPRRTFKQGNENLKPETAKSWVAGFVLDVPKVRGLSMTFDYWRIRQRDAITAFGIPDTFLRDELLLDLASQAALAAGKSISQIDLGSGTTNYQGYKNVTRAPVTEQDRAAFAAYNARQRTTATMRAPVGDFVSLINDYINLGGRNLEGYELGFPIPPAAVRHWTVHLKGEATRYVRREDELDGLTTSQLERNGFAKWRANATLVWRRGAWSAGWFTNYFGEFASTAATTTKAVYDALGAPKSIMVLNDAGIQRYYMRVAPYILHNAHLAYQFERGSRSRLRGITVRGGVNNVFDKIPPAVDVAESYQPGEGNPRGRQFTPNREGFLERSWLTGRHRLALA
jgi:outer membrane receptor protein involved in Fe transport